MLKPLDHVLHFLTLALIGHVLHDLTQLVNRPIVI
jgi:hypothetical protein